MKKLLFLIALYGCAFTCIIAKERWTIQNDGGILWNTEQGEKHTDHVEMSGKLVSVIATYGVNENNQPVINKQIIYPMLRTIPNDTHAHTIYTFGSETQPVIKINNRPIREQARSFYLKGILVAVSDAGNTARITRTLCPSIDKTAVIEKYDLTNTSDKEIGVEVEDMEKISLTPISKGVYGVYEIKAKTVGAGVYTIAPNKSISFAVHYSGRKITEAVPDIDTDFEVSNRKAFVDRLYNSIRFVCPDPVLSRMFDFAKLRAMESIYLTKNGLVHSPGGASYYSAIWANDQAEYANPLFAYSGYDTAIESAMTSWRWFAAYMNPEYRPIPSSIIAEGTSFWNGAGDRGDQAMIAYGASRFALALGDREKAEEIFPLIEWCIEFCKRKINVNGVVASDSDELEGRFPAGDANLCTSSLLYDALISASFLADELGKPKSLSNTYKRMANELKININRFFGATVEGFETYRYYEGNNVLRAWICIPLTVNIFDRKKGTIEALFSNRLWTDNGLLTEANDKTFWDRATLYGLRGAFMAGEREKAISFFEKYSNRRLLGDHVPYAVEAYPEGNQRHLSAESALYCRVVTEGIFGFRPTGFSSFEITPQLPEGWDYAELNNVIAFGERAVDIQVKRKEDKIEITVLVDNSKVKTASVANGGMVRIRL